jgi:hypothetical protein
LIWCCHSDSAWVGSASGSGGRIFHRGDSTLKE